MAWFAIDHDGSEWAFKNKPERKGGKLVKPDGEVVNLAKNTIKVLTGKELTPKSDPIEAPTIDWVDQ